MGNQLEKEYNIKEKPLKLPGSYNFLRFIHHPSAELSLIIVKSPHRATPVPSTLVLPIKEVRPLQNDSLAICHKCLPLCLFKPQSETQMRIVMHKILKSSAEIGRCFFYMGRVMLWCEEKRGLSSVSPEELELGKHHPKSKVFTSGVSLINFLHCVYEAEYAAKNSRKSGKLEVKTVKERVKEKLREKGPANESLPQEVRLFFEPRDKKEYYDCLYNMEHRLKTATFWELISEGLQELLLNMTSQDPDTRIDLDVITRIPYFMDSHQLRLYSTLTDELDSMSPMEARVFMSALELIVIEGLTIELSTMQDFFRPVLCSMVTYNALEGTPNDHLTPMALSILIELDRPPVDTIALGLKKAHPQNLGAVRLVLGKKERLAEVMATEQFDSVLSRALFSSFECEQLIGGAIGHVPFAMRQLKQLNYKKEIEYQLVHRILVFPVDKLRPGLLLLALKCMVHLLREQLLTSPQKLEILIFPPQKLDIELNFHVLFLYGLLIEQLPPHELLEKMMPKLILYLNDLELYDEIFVVAKRCLDRILERLYEQRKIKPSELVELEKDELYFAMPPQPLPLDHEQRKAVLRKEAEKHELASIQWAVDLL